MKNFRRDNRFGGGQGDRKFGGRDSGSRSFGNRDGGERRMYKATCSDCGDSCQVPFKPTGEKPVYCNNCFRDQSSFSNNYTERAFDKRSFDNRDFSKPSMHETICTECGKQCEVPFKPTSSKPVYCDECFGKDKGGNKKNNHSNEQFELLNNKLDQILQILTGLVVSNRKKQVEEIPVSEAPIEVSAEKTSKKAKVSKPKKVAEIKVKKVVKAKKV